jgi:hypothetical protein
LSLKLANGQLLTKKTFDVKMQMMSLGVNPAARHVPPQHQKIDTNLTQNVEFFIIKSLNITLLLLTFLLPYLLPLKFYNEYSFFSLAWSGTIISETSVSYLSIFHYMFSALQPGNKITMHAPSNVIYLYNETEGLL